MSEVFLGQIMMAGFPYAPRNFAKCDGQLLPLQQYQALFSLLGIRFGGNGSTTFGLPDMRGRVPTGYGASVDPGWAPPPMALGQKGGLENVTLSTAQIPTHTHQINARLTAGTTKNANNGAIGQSSVALYGDASMNPVQLNGLTCEPSGGSQPHPNMQPYCTINFCIALNGIFPSRS